jgi:hypothetical protein
LPSVLLPFHPDFSVYFIIYIFIGSMAEILALICWMKAAGNGHLSDQAGIVAERIPGNR